MFAEGSHDYKIFYLLYMCSKIFCLNMIILNYIKQCFVSLKAWCIRLNIKRLEKIMAIYDEKIAEAQRNIKFRRDRIKRNQSRLRNLQKESGSNDYEEGAELEDLPELPVMRGTDVVEE